MRKIKDVALTRSERNKRFYNNHKEQQLARNKAYYPSYYAKNGDVIRAKRRNRRHRITQEWFDQKLSDQNNCCALCEDVLNKTPHIDHDHRCCPPQTSCDKCRRDLLCDDCNLGLGRFGDSIKKLLLAVEYLRKHGKV